MKFFFEILGVVVTGGNQSGSPSVILGGKIAKPLRGGVMATPAPSTPTKTPATIGGNNQNTTSDFGIVTPLRGGNNGKPADQQFNFYLKTNQK